MPIYVYRCDLCSNQYEKKEGFDAPVEQACPQCGGVTRRLLQVPGIVFKGPGFYITDNRKNNGSEEREPKPALEGTTEVSGKP